MCVNLPLSFDLGWWACGGKAERGKGRWEAGYEVAGRGSCYIDSSKL